MSKGWSERDKKIVKTVIERAKRRAENEAVKQFQEIRVRSIEDIWDVETRIREWRKDRYGVFYVSYDRVEQQIASYLKQGWVLPDDLKSLSEERRARIMKS